MKLSKFLATALLAMAGVALVASSASAAITSYSDGDILLGFRKSGATQDYMIKIGTYSSLPTSGSITFSLGNIAADLTSAFGSSWFTGNNVYFQVFGNNTTGSGQIYIGNPLSTSQPSLSSGGVNSAFAALGDVTGGYNNQFSTSNSSVGFLETASAGTSYASYQPGGVNASGINWGVWSNTESLVNQNNYLDLYNVAGNGSAAAATAKGYFSIDNTGSVSYLAVPEPSTCAVLAVGALLMGVTNRRRKA